MDRPQIMHADVSYSYQGEEGTGSISVYCRAAKLKSGILPTGMFVGEPNSNWQIPSFNSHRLGQLHFSEAGRYEISLEMEPHQGEELGFQWLWLEEAE